MKTKNQETRRNEILEEEKDSEGHLKYHSRPFVFEEDKEAAKQTTRSSRYINNAL